MFLKLITMSTRTQKLSYLKSLEIQPPHPSSKNTRMCHEMASVSISRWQNCKELPNRSASNGIMECLILTIFSVNNGRSAVKDNLCLNLKTRTTEAHFSKITSLGYIPKILYLILPYEFFRKLFYSLQNITV